MGDVQASLRDEEALVLFQDSDDSFKPLPEQTFVWVVTKRDVKWVRSGLDMARLSREVASLRCGLNATAWLGDGARRRYFGCDGTRLTARASVVLPDWRGPSMTMVGERSSRRSRVFRGRRLIRRADSVAPGFSYFIELSECSSRAGRPVPGSRRSTWFPRRQSLRWMAQSRASGRRSGSDRLTVSAVGRAAGTPIFVNSVTMKDTGVILHVTPRVTKRAASFLISSRK